MDLLTMYYEGQLTDLTEIDSREEEKNEHVKIKEVAKEVS